MSPDNSADFKFVSRLHGYEVDSGSVLNIRPSAGQC